MFTAAGHRGERNACKLVSVLPVERFSVFTVSHILRPGTEYSTGIYDGWTSYNDNQDTTRGKGYMQNYQYSRGSRSY